MEAIRERFEEVFQEYLPKVKRLATRSAANPDDAEDLVQEVFVRAYDAFDRFKPGAGVGPWLYRIAVNVCANAAKVRQRHQKFVAGGLEDWQMPAGLCYSADDLARKQDHSRLRQAMSGLSSDQLILLTLRFSDGLTLPEIAEVLGVPVDTAKSRLKVALTRLQSAYSFTHLGADVDVQGQGLDRLLIDEDRRGRIYHSLGLLYLRKGLVSAALQEWGKSQRVAPDFLDAYLDSARQYVALDQPAKAVETLETAVSRIRSADLHIRLAELYLDKLNDIDESKLHSQRAIELEPCNPQAHHSAGKAYYYQAGEDQCLMWANPHDHSLKDVSMASWRKSASFFEEAIRIKQVFPDANSLLAVACFRQEQTERAVKEMDKAVSDAGEDARILYRAGWLHFFAGNEEKARGCLRRSVAVDPIPECVELLGWIPYEQQDDEEAYEVFQQALSLTDDNKLKARIHANMSVSAMRLGRLDEAMEHAETSLRLDSDQVHARCHIAELHLKQGGRPWFAVNLCMEGRRLDPYHKCFSRHLGEAYFRMGKYADALGEATGAVELEPENARVWLLRAKILAKLGQYDEARQDVMAALDLESDNEEATAMLEEIDRACRGDENT